MPTIHVSEAAFASLCALSTDWSMEPLIDEAVEDLVRKRERAAREGQAIRASGLCTLDTAVERPPPGTGVVHSN